MTAIYTIVPDPAHALIRVQLAGFFSEQDVRDFAAAYGRALDMLGTPPNAHDTLCDITNMKIQAQQVVHAFSHFMQSPQVQSRKLAFITTSSLARIQAQRLTDRDTVEYFSDPDEAAAWLQH